MASKVPSTNTEHIVSRVPCPLPSALTLDTVLLGSAIPLEPHTRICYRAFTSSSLDASQCAQYVEAARQSIVAQKAQALVESLLPSTYVSGTGSATLFVFALETTGTPSEAVSKLQTAVFGDLTGVSSLFVVHNLELIDYSVIGSKLASFTPGQVYPCSDACALLHEPCPRCQESAQGMSNTPPSAATPRSRTNNTRSAACLLPRKPLRNILVHFLDAVRCRLIDDISERAASDAGRTPIRRLQDGFLLGPSPRSSEWAIGWQKQTNPRYVA